MSTQDALAMLTLTPQRDSQTHRTVRQVAIGSLLALTLAEIAGPLLGIVPAASAQALLLVFLLVQAARLGGQTEVAILPALALLPLLRLLSLTMPLPSLPILYWYALVGAPLLGAAVLTARVVGLPRARLARGSWVGQLGIGLSGIAWGIGGGFLFRPLPLFSGTAWGEVILAALIVALLVGVVEEVIFRGLLQPAATALFGSAGVLYSAVLYTVMYSSTLSPGYMLFMGLLGLFFGWCVHRTQASIGVCLAHALFCIVFLILTPLWRG